MERKSGRRKRDGSEGESIEAGSTKLSEGVSIPEKQIEVDAKVLHECRSFRDASWKNGGNNPLPEWVFDDNKSCFGGVVKSEGKVIQSLLHCHPSSKGLNINCVVETFGNLMADLNDDNKRKWIADMGFENLLFFGGRGLARQLCYWLYTRVNPYTRTLHMPDGKEFSLSYVHVHWLLGLPIGGREVQLHTRDKNTDDGKEIEEFINRYGKTTKSRTRGIPRKNLLEAFKNTTDEREFKKVFLMLALTDVLCPTTCHRTFSKLLPAVTMANDAKKYNWCDLVLDHLMESVKSFSSGFYPNGFAKGAGGCSYFLAVMYLDRIRRPPLQWRLFPRIAAWDEGVKRRVAKDDMKSNGDYGKLGSVDAAYGRPHPRAVKDLLPGEVMPEEEGNGVFRNFIQAPSQSSCASGVYVNLQTVKRKRKKINYSKVSPYELRRRKRARKDLSKAGGTEKDGQPRSTNHVEAPSSGDNYS